MLNADVFEQLVADSGVRLQALGTMPGFDKRRPIARTHGQPGRQRNGADSDALMQSVRGIKTSVVE